MAQVSSKDGLVDIGPEPRSVRFQLGEERAAGIHAAHLVVRGTYLPGTVRCIAENTHRAPPYTSLGDWSTPTGIGLVKCYTDVRVNAYILGSGPSSLTVVVQEIHYWWDVDQEKVEELRGSAERVFIEGGYHPRVNVPADGIAGREEILFLGPAVDASVESWQVFTTWDVEERDDGTVIAVHPNRDAWRTLSPTDYQTYRSALEMELPAFAQAVTMANQSRVTEYGGRVAADTTYPMLVTDANQLRQFFTNIGAYSHPEGPPSQPPLVYAPRLRA